MAIDRDTLKFLLHLQLSLTGKRVLTIGRLEWYGGKLGIDALNRKTKSNLVQSKYAEFVFSALGSNRIDSLDYSAYEGASIQHDLNFPVPEELHNQFDFILDAGSLEHIYNCQEAIRSYMKMCTVGGSLVLVLPTNNQMGHGFYQFSPEFFYRTLCEDQGFKVVEMLLRTGNGFGKWFEIKDPKVIGARHEIRTFTRTMLFIHAVKISEKSRYIPVIQSDYESATDMAKISKWGQRYLSSPPVIQFWIRQLVLKPRYQILSMMRMKRIHLKY